jgi:hypothetical protein
VTVQRKGHDKPLYETGKVYDAITHRTEVKRRK